MEYDLDQRNDASSWEAYWKLIMSDPTGKAPWSLGPVEMLMPYLSELIDSFDPALPLVDLGCGDGVLTGHLAERFDVVVGVDISEAAVAKARRDNGKPNISYEQLDATDTLGARRLHSRIGDANVHLRGVLHAMMPHDWPRALESLGILVGDRGSVFDVEASQPVSEAIKNVTEHFGETPAWVHQLLRCGLVSHSLPAAELAGLYRGGGWSVQSTGDLAERLQVLFPDGAFPVQSFHYVIAAKDSVCVEIVPRSGDMKPE